MDKRILEHYQKTGTYTYAGGYGDYFRSLPDDISVLGRLVCGQVIHRVTLKEGNTNANAKLLYGDMNRYPWYRMRCEDDMLLTAPALTAELFRLDGRGFVKDRRVENKIVVTCRYVSVLMSAILKAKGIPARCRAGFAPYFHEGVSMDHWINQYYSKEKERWITFDADGFTRRAACLFLSTICHRRALTGPPKPTLPQGAEKQTGDDSCMRTGWEPALSPH